MEVAFFLIAVVGLLALTSSQSGASSVVGPQNQYPPYMPPPQPYTPQPVPQFNPPMVPSQGANVGAAVFSGTSQIGTTAATSVAKNMGTAANAVPIIGAAVGAAIAVAAALLAAHSARLKGATNENQAVDQYDPVFVSFVNQLVAAYNSGQISKQQAATTAQQFDRALYNSLRALVGAAGTHWVDIPNGPCNKSCTVGCCIYWGIFAPALDDISYVLGFPTGKYGQGDYRISGRTVTIVKFNPSKYSPYTRAAFSVTLK
jgi:hypothetical protein